jgi:hypothetical protein
MGGCCGGLAATGGGCGGGLAATGFPQVPQKRASACKGAPQFGQFIWWCSSHCVGEGRDEDATHRAIVVGQCRRAAEVECFRDAAAHLLSPARQSAESVREELERELVQSAERERRPCIIWRVHVARRRRVGEIAVVVFAAGLAEAVRALGWAGSLVLYAFALSAVALVFWLFVLAG